MPAFYALGTSKAGVNTANTVMWQLLAAASDRVRIQEMLLSTAVAPTTPPIWEIRRATANFGTASATIVPQPIDPSDPAAVAVLQTAWSVAPTLSTAVALRNQAHGAAVGAGFLWDFRREPLEINVSTGLQIINTAASGATLGQFSLSMIFEE